VHQKVALHLPRFEVRQKGSILGIVKALGLDRAADPGTADFRGIADPPDPADRLFVDNVAHGAYLKVDEAGTEAAAATALVMALGAAPPPPDEPIPFVVDHPFLFVLRHAATGAILFLGRVEDPTS
jgi:serpin B